MSVVLARRVRLKPARRPVGGLRRQSEPDAPVSRRKKALYRAIVGVHAFMHGGAATDRFARDLRRCFPAPMYFLESNRQVLERQGLNRLDAFYYCMIPSLTRTCMSQQWGEHPCLVGLETMGEYLKTLYLGIHVECFYLIMLNRQGRLIRPMLLQRGGVDNAPFYLPQLLAAALQEEARYLVLAHNHPGGTRRPSGDDLCCTLRAMEAFAPLGIPLLDHIIVAGDEVISIRRSELLPAMLWTSVQPGSRIVSLWLDSQS